MKISSRYTIALQLLCIFEVYRDNKITSNFIAEKTGADSSTVRYIMLDLKKKTTLSQNQDLVELSSAFL